MSVIVHQMSHSPFCIPVTAMLTALGVAHETREVPNWDRRAILELTDGAYLSSSCART
jgi:glutathione S-transferase